MMPLRNDPIKKEGGSKSDLGTPENIDNQGKDKHIFSFFKAPITNKFSSKNTDIQELYELIKGDSFISQTMRLRSSTTKEDAKQRKSSDFDFVTFSGVFSERNSRCLVTRSIYICIDLDHIGDKDAILEIQILILDKLRPALMFISPSGDGLKVVYRIDVDSGTHLQYFKALQVYFKEVIGFEIDPSGSDICRVCFIPYDPDAYYDKDCEILDGSLIDTFANTVELPNDKGPEVNANRHSLTTHDIIDNLIIWLNASVSFAPGSRNSFVSRLAYACNRYGIQENETLNRLLSYSELGFDESEIKAIVKSAYKHTEWFNISAFKVCDTEAAKCNLPDESSIYAKESLKNDIKTPLLPIHGFPTKLQELILECATVYGTPRDFWATSILQATAIAMGSTMEIKDKYSNGPLLWIALVAPSGMGKSEPLDLALKPIFEADIKLQEEYNIAKKEYDAIMELSSKERKAQGIDIPKEPQRKQYIIIDSTPEALMEAHSINLRGLAIFRDEIAGMILDYGRYSRSGEVQNMLSSYSEKIYKVTRKNSESRAIKKPFIPIIGGIQPGRLNLMAKDDRAVDGFMQRFLFAYPDDLVKPEYNEAYLRETFKTYYRGYINHLLSISSDRKTILLSQEAKDLYKEFYNRNTALFNAQKCEYLRAVYQKLEIAVLRIALILHVSNHVEDEQYDIPIKAQTMSAAIDMIEYFRITAHKVYLQIGQAESSVDKLDNRSVARYLMRLKKGTKAAIASVLGTSRSQLDRLLE